MEAKVKEIFDAINDEADQLTAKEFLVVMKAVFGRRITHIHHSKDTEHQLALVERVWNTLNLT